MTAPTAEALEQRCVAFVDAQSEGEWGDELVAKDAAKLAEFVRREVAAGVAAERERAAGKLDEMREYLEAAPQVLLGWSVTQAKIRLLRERATAIRQEPQP
jgi:hypothetical protein